MVAGYKTGVADIGGVQATATGTPTDDGPAQVSLFNEATKTSRGGITVFTITPDVFAKPMAAAVKSGIPLIALANPPAPSANVDLLVANDNADLGKTLGEAIAANLPAGSTGTVVLGTIAPGAQSLDQRAAGVREAIKSRHPGTKIVGPFDTKDESAENLAAWKTLIRANPKAVAFVGTAGVDAVNLAQIRTSTGATWQAGGFDVTPEALQYVADGNLVVVSAEHYTEGVVAGRLQAMRAKGTALPKGWIIIPGLAITKDNVAEIRTRGASDATRATWHRTAADKILQNLAKHLRDMPDQG
jgi:ribose transport system substrate-binding protein